MAAIFEKTTKSGEKRYKAIIRLRGYPQKTATFKRKTDARRWISQVETELLEGRYYGADNSKKYTFEEMVNRYLTDVVPIRHSKPLASRAVKCHLTWWKSHLGRYLISDVGPDKIVALRDKLLNSPILDSNGKPVVDEHGNIKRKKSSSTVTRYLASLSVMYTTAVNEWGWARENPVLKVKRPSEPRGRARFLSDEERERLLKACAGSANKLLYPIVVLAISTGARQGELLNLRWKQVDLDRRVIRLDDTKNNERRALPLTGLALSLMKELNKKSGANPGSYVFPSADGKRPNYIVTAWENALRDAEIEDFRFHDLRHTAASYLAMNGATLAEIAEVLGHKTLQMVKRYAHMSDQHTASVVERMNHKIFAAANDNKEVNADTEEKAVKVENK